MNRTTLPLYTYRFSSNYGMHNKHFSTDNEAFEYASECTDGPDMVLVEKFWHGDWFSWDSVKDRWVYSNGPIYENALSAKQIFAV